MANVPEILKQKCEEINLIKPIELCAIEGGLNTGKFLTCRGVNTEFFYIVEEHKLILYETSNDASEPYFIWTFDVGTLIFDAVYFPINETTKGIAVALWEPSMDITQSNYIAFISLRNKQIIRKILMPCQIECLCTIYDGVQMSKEKLKLQKAFHENWPHILLVGASNGLACLIHFDTTTDEIDKHSEQIVKPKKCITLSKIFTSEADEYFRFKSDEGQIKTMKKSVVSVTSVHYIEKAHCLAIGYNFGGLLFVSLVTQKVQCIYLNNSAVENFAVQEPEDDPRPILYLWTMLKDNVSKKYMALLITVNFPLDEEDKTKKSSDWTYEIPCFTPQMKWFPDNCTRFLSMQTVFVNRGQISDDKPVELNESGQMNSSLVSLVNSRYETCLMLMTWIQVQKDQKAKLHGALFDLNMFYYKRLNPCIRIDGTIASQFPFLSRFSSKDDFSVDPKDILDIVIRPQTIHRFFVPTMVTDTFDQLYYPSTFTFDAKILTKYTLLDIRIRSLQDQLLLHLANHLVKYYLDPKESSEWLCSIALTNRIPRVSTQEERVCLLKSLLHNAYHHSISLLLVDERIGDEDRKFVVKWLWKEVEHAKAKLDEYCGPWFAGVSGLSTAAKLFVRNMEPFFMRVESVLKYLLDHCEPETNMEKEWVNLIKMKHLAIEGLVFYAKMLNFSRFYKLLPENELTVEVRKKMLANFEERKKKAREFGHSKLEISKFIEEIMKAEPDVEIWENKQAEEWYPPSYKNLMGTLLLVNISNYAKSALLGYYFQDFDYAKIWTELKQPMYHHFFHFAIKLENYVEHKYKIDRLWSDDDKAARNLLRKLVVPLKLIVEKKMPTRPEDMDNCPLIDKDDVERAKEVFMNFEYGAHKWNKFVIARRRFDLIVETPPPSLDCREPTDITECRLEVDRIRVQMPFLFEKIESIPEDIIQKYREIQARYIRQEASITLKHKQKPAMLLNVRSKSTGTLSTNDSTSRKRDFFKDEDIDDGNFELRMSTPAKRGRFQIPATPMSALRAAQPLEADSPLINSVAIESLGIRQKYLERIRKIMQSPATAKSVNSNSLLAGLSSQFLSPVVSDRMQLQPPTSILKTATKNPPKKDLDGTPLRLRFDLPTSSNAQQDRMLPEALIFEDPSELSNDAIDGLPTDDSSLCSSSFSVSSPPYPEMAPTPIRLMEIQQAEDVVDKEEEDGIYEDVNIQSERLKEIDSLKPQAREEQEPIPVELKESENDERVATPTDATYIIDNENENDGTYIIVKRKSFEEQDPNDSTAWPDEEEDKNEKLLEQQQVKEVQPSDKSDPDVDLPSTTRRWAREHKIPNVTPKRKTQVLNRTVNREKSMKALSTKRANTPEQDVHELDSKQLTPRRSTRAKTPEQAVRKLDPCELTPKRSTRAKTPEQAVHELTPSWSTRAKTPEQAEHELTPRQAREHKIPNVTPKRKTQALNRTLNSENLSLTNASPTKRAKTPEQDVHELAPSELTPRRSARLAAKQATPSKK